MFDSMLLFKYASVEAVRVHLLVTIIILKILFWTEYITDPGLHYFLLQKCFREIL